MRLKSQIINKVSLSLSLTRQPTIKARTYFLLLRLTFRVVRGEFMHTTTMTTKKKSDFSWIFSFLLKKSESSQRVRRKEGRNETLLHFNADQNTQKVFLFVGVCKWCVSVSSSLSLTLPRLNRSPLRPLSPNARRTLYSPYILHN